MGVDLLVGAGVDLLDGYGCCDLRGSGGIVAGNTVHEHLNRHGASGGRGHGNLDVDLPDAYERGRQTRILDVGGRHKGRAENDLRGSGGRYLSRAGSPIGGRI